MDTTYTVKLKDDGSYDLYLPQVVTDIDGNQTTILNFDSNWKLEDLQNRIASLQQFLDAINAFTNQPINAKPVFVSTDVPVLSPISEVPVIKSADQELKP